MIFDFNTAVKKDFSSYDICIAGAGAAGISLARKLALSGKKVALLEGGDKEYSQASQDIYAGKSIGLEYYLDLWRLRFLGGTTNHWSGRCRPFNPEDFRKRDFSGLPGWAITFDDMNKYLPETLEILNINPNNPFKIRPGTHISSKQFIPDTFVNSEPVRFAQKYSKFLSENPNIDVYINANLTKINLDTDLQTITSFTINNYQNTAQEFKAKKFVLCLGAIETARILLNSNHQLTAGIGNKTDMVGRCFMEHFNLDLGEFILNPDEWQQTKSMSFFTEPKYHAQHNLGLSNFSLKITDEIKAYGRTAELKKIFNQLSCNLGITDKLQFIYKHKCLGEGVISTLFEQFPNKNSRVSLIPEVDQFGLKKLAMDWQMSALDVASIRTVAINFAKEFAQANLGRIKLPDYILDKQLPIPTGAHAHQMGTTRMAKEYQHGVVDENCKVFATNNLYIAGSGVFSTGGGNNPTMPLIQLTLRLADHLL